MDSQRSLEQLVAQTTIANCQRKLVHCDPSERDLLLAIINESRMELEDLDEQQPVDPPPRAHLDYPAQRWWFHES
jgi:hypothetical protein